MQYLNQHTRQLGLEAPSFVSPKEKQYSSNKIEKQKSSSSDRKKTERIVPTKNESEQTLPISKRNLAENPAIKKKKEKFFSANIAAEPRVNNEEHTKIMRTMSVVSNMTIHLRCSTSTPTWARHQGRIRIINPRVMSNHLHPLRLLTAMVANVIFAMILIIW
jgi:hypothetical protein